MKTLELECPGCEQMLELDAGFAGGVCRCSNCGTLMTVPVDGHQAAEAVSQRRPDRPDTPGASRPARPERPATPGTPGTSAPPTTPDEPGKAVADEPEAAEPAASESPADAFDFDTEPSEQVYTTASGKEVRVSGHARIPTATKKKRPIVRAATALVFVGVLLSVLVMSAAAVWVLSTVQRETAERNIPPSEAFVYNNRTNPYDIPHANVLGLPLAESAVIVVDAADASRLWLAEVNDAVRAGLLHREAGNVVNLVYATGDDRQVYPTTPQPLTEWREREVIAFHSGIASEGEPSPGLAVERALHSSPRQVIFITGRRPTETDLDHLRTALDRQESVLFDVITVDRDVPALQDVADRYLGRYVPVTTMTIERWQEEADDAEPSGETEANAMSENE